MAVGGVCARVYDLFSSVPFPEGWPAVSLGGRAFCERVTGYFLAGVFAVGAVSKLFGISAATAALSRPFGVQNWWIIWRLVLAVSVWEIALAIALLCRRWVGVLLLAPSVFITIFIIWDGVRFAVGDEPDCGCFGTIMEFRSWVAVWAKDAFIFALASAYIALNWRYMASRSDQ